jgi:hypothetical protein
VAFAERAALRLLNAGTLGICGKDGTNDSAVLIALVGLMYFAVAIDQALIQHNAWNGLIWLGYALAQIGLWHVTVQP